MSLASWALLGWAATAPPLTPVRVAISALHLTVALSIARRSRLVRIGSPHAMATSLPALVVAGVAFRHAEPLPEWPLSLQCLFIIGAAIAILAFLILGESFAMLPAIRGVVTRGPYRLVRHPAYTGELLMVLACLLSRPSAWSALLFLGAVPLVVLRVLAEENLLRETDRYRRYSESVRHRLVPGVW